MNNRREMIISKHHGGTILEVLIASLIFAAVLFALIQFQMSLTHDRALITQKTEALNLAQNQLQSFRNYTQLNSSTDPKVMTYDGIISGSNQTTMLNTVYTTTWTVTSSTDQPQRKNVTVLVQWTDPTNTVRTTTIYGVIARIDPKGTARVSQGLPS